MKTAAKVRNADYAFFNIVLAVVVTGLLAFVAAVSGVFGGWPAVEMSIVIIYMAVFAVIIFLLIAIF